MALKNVSLRPKAVMLTPMNLNDSTCDMTKVLGKYCPSISLTTLYVPGAVICAVAVSVPCSLGGVGSFRDQSFGLVKCTVGLAKQLCIW